MTLSFRLVVWNCAGGFRQKRSALTRLLPDIAIIPEASDDFALGLPTSSSLWLGTQNARGLGVLALNGWTLERADIGVEERLFLPCVARREGKRIQVVAVCVKKTTRGYVFPMLEALQKLADFISAGPTILAGDFNGSVKFEKRPKPFTLVIDRLDRLDMRSAWHHFRGESFGSESVPTLYKTVQNVRKEFHIDYAFVSSHFVVEAAEIGSYAEYPSDHAPLAVDLCLPSERLPAPLSPQT